MSKKTTNKQRFVNTSGFTIGKPNPSISMENISVLHNSDTKSFTRAVSKYLTRVLHINYTDPNHIDSMLHVNDADVWSTNLTSVLEHIGISVKLYCYDNSSNGVIYITQYGSSDYIANIVCDKANKFSLIDSMHGLTDHNVGKRVCTSLPIKKIVESTYVTPIKEKQYIAPSAPIKQNHYCNENSSEIPQIEIICKRNEEYLKSNAEKEHVELANRFSQTSFIKSKKSKKDKLIFAHTNICKKIAEQQLYMEVCVKAISKLAEKLSENTKKTLKHEEYNFQHEKNDLSNVLIEKLFKRREQQIAIQSSINMLLVRKEDLELFIDTFSLDIV